MKLDFIYLKCISLRNNISCRFGGARSVSGEPHQKPLRPTCGSRAPLWAPLVYNLKQISGMKFFYSKSITFQLKQTL
jgi:hypothetical protein